MVPCKGWIQVTSYDTKVQEVQSDDRQSKAIIHLLAVEFKKLLSSYPQIKTSVSGNLLQLFETGALE